MSLKCKLPKNVADIATKRAVDGIIDILQRAYCKDCEIARENGERTLDFLSFTDKVVSMSVEEFAKIPIMSKSEYYGDE